ncbi:UdgX family uracil-DNA binding protein, partial [Kribbella albertanoniae]
AGMMLVGEQPGDVEDKEGRVFVGPAGRLLDKALAAAGIDRGSVYLTNAVKHFRFEERGKRRIHKTPAVSQIVACTPWLSRELEIVKPELVVVLGSVAARALLGNGFKVTERRGQPVELPDGTAAMATVHPSSVVRSEEYRRDFDLLVDDLRSARSLAAAGHSGKSKVKPA